MHTAYYNEYSYHLDRMMGFKVYGHAGRPCLVFPAQSGRFYDFENFGMVGAVQDLLEQGRLQLFTCDSIDSVSYTHLDVYKRQPLSESDRELHAAVGQRPEII